MNIKALIFLSTILFTSQAVPSDTTRFFEDWFSGNTGDKEHYAAGTINESNAALIFRCSSSLVACTWHLQDDRKCVIGSEYSVLVNASTGSFTSTILCQRAVDKTTNELTFTEFTKMETAISGGAAKIGIAIPLEGDQFLVYRFSLKGAASATAHAQDEMLKKTKNSTKNQTL